MNVLTKTDPEIAKLIQQEDVRQRETLRMIPSENYVSKAVMEATGSSLTNKYSEGYAGKRYYQGQANIDEIEALAISRATSLFGADHANVQPYSGSPANLAMYVALAEVGDTIMGMALDMGGHLTHGWKASQTSKFYNAVQYPVDPKTHLIDFDVVRDLAKKHKPKVIVSGATAYPRFFDYAAFKEIADEVGAVCVADIAHVAGLIAADVHPDPVPHAGVVTTTTHKTLRGPRGGMILCKEEYAKAIDRAVFPFLQGGPHNHTTAGIAVALKEAAAPSFKEYAAQIITNAAVLAEGLMARDWNLISGGTDNHLILVDMQNKNLSGKDAAVALERAGIVVNANSIPYDPAPPFKPSGIRLGTPGLTTRGMKEEQMRILASVMADIVDAPEDEAVIAAGKKVVDELAEAFPIPESFVEEVSQAA
ncbi:MAG: serine hydroxymethyltransferase [Candidatus Doudnabacteria bacterium]|nr:serine hydroxymethyltransferase [Candidatus Doudnabacteria bacterium]